MRTARCAALLPAALMCQGSPFSPRHRLPFPSTLGATKQSARAPYQSMRAQWKEWEALGASPDLVRQIQFGPRLPRRVDRSCVPRRLANAYKLSPRDNRFAQEEIARWLANGFATEITLADAKNLRVVSPAFVIHVAKQRLVVDYSYVNGYMSDTPFRMERLMDLAPQICPGDSLFQVDIKDGYYHLGFRPIDRPLLAFRIGNRYFVTLALNCGLKPAPYLFTKFLRPFVRAIRSNDHRCFSYLDDVGGAPRKELGAAHATPSDTSTAKAEIHELGDRLDILMHPVKNGFSGTTSLDMLGILVDTDEEIFTLSSEKLSKVRQPALGIQGESKHNRRLVSASRLRSFGGLAQSVSLAVTDSLLHLRTIWDMVAVADASPPRRIRLSRAAYRDLTWWANLDTWPGLGRSIWPPAPKNVLSIHSDANTTGWGAVAGVSGSGAAVFRPWEAVPANGEQPASSVIARGLFAPVLAVKHINFKELVAALFSVISFAQHPAGRSRSIVAGLRGFSR